MKKKYIHLILFLVLININTTWAQNYEPRITTFITQFQRDLNALNNPNASSKAIDDIIKKYFNNDATIWVEDDLNRRSTSTSASAVEVTIKDYLRDFKIKGCNIQFNIGNMPNSCRDNALTYTVVNISSVLSCNKQNSISRKFEIVVNGNELSIAQMAFADNTRLLSKCPTTPISTPSPTPTASNTYPNTRPPTTTTPKTHPKPKPSKPKPKPTAPCNCQDQANACCTTLNIAQKNKKPCDAIRDTIQALYNQNSTLKRDTFAKGQNSRIQAGQIVQSQKDIDALKKEKNNLIALNNKLNLAKDSLANIIKNARKAPIEVYCIINENEEDERKIVLTTKGVSKKDYKLITKQRPPIKIACPINPSLFPDEKGNSNNVIINIEKRSSFPTDGCYGENSSIPIQSFYEGQLRGNIDCNFESFDDDENTFYSVNILYQGQSLAIDGQAYRFKIAPKKEPTKTRK
jgi:hypothetical protein